ncbi:MAG TPA: L,D-transpeptidase family protein [Thermomonas sp.]|nr:L,D-transpeptidase family protein [Thermomonas sp.]
MDTTPTSRTAISTAGMPGFRKRLLALALACVALPALAQQAPASIGTDSAADVPAAIEANANALQPGEFLWMPERGGAGQLVVVVSLPEQRAHVYRNGVRIGVSTVSTGTASHPTPTGTFEILQKKRMHHSNLYNNAPMPFMQRLTWDGIALHAGTIPGYPASHGCVRLPLAFAEKLFEETERGMLVVIADESSHDASVLYPGERAPVDAYSGLPRNAIGNGPDTAVAAAP